MPTVRDSTYELLRALGMTTIFGNPGSTEEPFLQDFPDDFRYILGLQEAAVIGIADGFAQATGRAAFVNLHTAPGVGHAMGNLVTAWYNRTPLVVTAGQQTRRMLAIEPWLVNREAVDLPKPYVKWSHEPARAEDVPAAIERAYHLAMHPPRGPVFVSVPMDDWDAPAPPHSPRTVGHRVAPDPVGGTALAARINTSRRPVLVAGAAIDRSDAWTSAVALAERLRAPVWAAPASERAGFPQDHPLFQGQLPLAMAPLADRLSGHDLVLVLGAPVFRYYPYVPGPVVPAGADLVQVTDDPDEAARAPAGTALVGDVALLLESLLTTVEPADRAAPPRRSPPSQPPASAPMSSAYVLHALARAMPTGTIVVEEAASNRGPFYDQIRINQPSGYFATASGGLGFAVPAAVGVQLARPNQPVVCVVGEGAAMYAVQALWTAAHHRLPVVFVVLNNGHYAILKSFAAFGGHGDRIPGLDLPGLDVVAIATGFGCSAQRIEHAAGLEDRIRAAFDDARRDGLPTLLDIAIDPSVPALLPAPSAGAAAVTAR